MKNFEKYKTADERAEACKSFLDRHEEYDRMPYIDAAFAWLELEAEEEKPLPCPFCGGKMNLMFEQNNDTHCLVCNGGCGYTTGAYVSETEAIRWHNRVARAVMATKESEVK